MADRSKLKQALLSTNVRAFLRAIRLGEGTWDEDGYYRLCGGELIRDLTHHPRKKVWIPRYGVWSSAFGAYQINWPTWNDLVEKWGFSDFYPDTQDEAAVALIIRAGALDEVLEGKIAAAIHLCNDTWASLPGSHSGQRTEAFDDVIAEYQKFDGAVVS